MMQSISRCTNILELNRARRDLFYQVYKKQVTPEELDNAYEDLATQARIIGVKYYRQYFSYGPVNVGAIEHHVKGIRKSIHLEQFNGYLKGLFNNSDEIRWINPGWQFLYQLLMDQADFQGYSYNQKLNKFFDT